MLALNWDYSEENNMNFDDVVVFVVQVYYNAVNLDIEYDKRRHLRVFFRN